MFAKINKISPITAALIIAFIGCAVYFTGLTNPFEGDDTSQIVNNVPVHSITHIKLFFEGGTFYYGHGLVPLGGVYFRPLMTTIFSLLYTIFGPHAIAFHSLQLLLCIGSAIFLYMFLRYSFKPGLALILSLIFLVHPLNSQVAFYIPTMQDALFFFFGILALWLLLRFNSIRSLLLVATCLFLSLLSKETGLIFVAMSLLLLFWFSKERLNAFMGIMVLPIASWLILKSNAIGLIGKNPNNAPIASLNLASRLYTAPSIVLFFITKFIFPWKLASAYYWVYPTFSISHVLIPLIIDLAVLCPFVYLGFVIRKKTSTAQLFTYLFFAIWCLLGLLAHLQIVPLDMTVSETWFYFPMVGVLGMIGVFLVTFQSIRSQWVLIIGGIVIGTLGVRTSIRGLDWKSQLAISYSDIKSSKEDYTAYSAVAGILIDQGKFNVAKPYAAQSVKIFPTSINNFYLGEILTSQNNYSGAVSAYNNAFRYQNSSAIADKLGALTAVYGNFSSDANYLTSALNYFPNDAALWTDVAILQRKGNDNKDAVITIKKAASLGNVPNSIYEGIITNKPFLINVGESTRPITIN